MKSSNPKVTVFMPVYNGEKHLQEAIESVLRQTYTDFEFLIINDGSTDKSTEIIESYKDARICLVHNKNNMRIAATRNRGLELAKGEYLVSMDCDDICLPDRVSKLVDFMDSNPDVGVCGSWFEKFGENTKSKIVKFPLEYDSIKASLFFFCSILNPSSILRLKYFRDNNLTYNTNLTYSSEDYDIWLRAAKHFKLGNIPEVLLRYRVIPDSLSHRINPAEKEEIKPVLAGNLELLDIKSDQERLDLYYKIYSEKFVANEKFLITAEKWLEQIQKSNFSMQIYNNEAFNKALGEKWFNLCLESTDLGLFAYNAFYKSPLINYTSLNLKQKTSFAVKCLAGYKPKLIK